MEVIELAVKNMETLAVDNSHGYDQGNRWGPDYDCSSAVITAWQNAGVPVKTNGATYTGNMRNAFLVSGFSDVTNEINLQTGAGLQRGDVLLNYSSHTAMYVGYGTIAHASINEFGGTTGGASGDQTGMEICLRSYYNYPWNCVLRYTKESKPTPTPIPTPEPIEEVCEVKLTLPVLGFNPGKKSLHVAIAQKALIDKNFTCGGYGDDGYFGNGTLQSVKNFREENNLPDKDVIDSEFWEKLLSI